MYFTDFGKRKPFPIVSSSLVDKAFYFFYWQNAITFSSILSFSSDFHKKKSIYGCVVPSHDSII